MDNQPREGATINSLINIKKWADAKIKALVTKHVTATQPTN